MILLWSLFGFYLWLISKELQIGIWLCALTQVWYFTNRGFKAICFEKNDYYHDDLGAPNMWFQLGIDTLLDGAAPMERPPLGGEGYQWEVNSLIENVLHLFWVERKEVSVRWSRPNEKTIIRRRGLSARWS